MIKSRFAFVRTKTIKRGSLFALVFLSGCAQVFQAGFDPLSWRSLKGDGSLTLKSSVPLWVVGYRAEDDQGFVGAAELSPDGEARPFVVNLVNRRTRCDGLMEPSAAPFPDVPLDTVAHITCTNGTSILVRFAFSSPDVGQGIGRDASGNHYQFTAYLREDGDGQKLSKRLKALSADAPMEPVEPLLQHVSERQSSATRRTLLNSKLRAIRRQEHPVPRYMYGSLPKNLPNIDNPQRRKAIFLRIILPLIAQSNEMILKDRAHLLGTLDRVEGGEKLGELDRLWLARLARRYRTKPGEHSTLRYRVDAIPTSLAIAQAALETGWGRSRFVHTGNALYGEWTFGKARGIVPNDRGDGQDHKIRSFDNLLHSVTGYMNNLNSHTAYRRFRDIRARAGDEIADSRKLARSLKSYGKGDPKYTTKLRTIISANRLRDFDTIQLAVAEIGMPRSAVPTPRKKPKPRLRVAANASAEGSWWSVRKWLK